MMITESKEKKLRFVKHANNKIAAKFIVCPGDDSVVGTRAYNIWCLFLRGKELVQNVELIVKHLPE